MNSLRLTTPLILQLKTAGAVTHFSRPLHTPDGTPVPADVQAVPEPDSAAVAFHLPDEVLVLRPALKVGRPVAIKERWRVGAWKAGHVAVDYGADGYARAEWLPVREPLLSELIRGSIEDLQRTGYQPDEEGDYRWDFGRAPTRWRKPDTLRAHLARFAAQPTHVRLVRLSDLTHEDALNAGMLHVSEGWMRQHFPTFLARYTRVNSQNAERVDAEGPGVQLLDVPEPPAPLDRLRADLRRRHEIPPGQDVWLWAADLRRLDQTPAQLFEQAARQTQDAS
ncbi:hypothetical protein [Deinococcus radiotolerans]|uniref:Uncharacterized protein n=1 Tax=Deinococcus radiotolerans TaxID=1309407 RepID=A0ABQ2FQG1_9DEIO|nr:hypothetical protein [Deinococcus radiotolerans]GGL16611.1 hypothetical protein GCM10010844_39410 [Deinococcus radiotolerans]